MTAAPSLRATSSPAWKAAARPLLLVSRTMWSTPAARATSTVVSCDPSSITSHSTVSKPSTTRGRSANMAGSCSASFLHGTWMISFTLAASREDSVLVVITLGDWSGRDHEGDAHDDDSPGHHGAQRQRLLQDHPAQDDGDDGIDEGIGRHQR